LSPAERRIRLTQLGLAEKHRGALEEATEWFTRALEQNPQSSVIHFCIGETRYNRGLNQEALEALTRATELNREYRVALDAGEDRRLVLQAIAEVHLLRRDYPAALELYERLLEETPDSPKLWNERGVVLHQLGRLPEALESYQRAVQHAPGNWAPR
jgi:tetratricopeptide (TPR) repeat protein